MAVVFGEAGSEHFRHRGHPATSLGRVVRTPAARATLGGYVGVGWAVTGMVLPAFIMQRSREVEPGIAALALAAAAAMAVLVLVPVGWNLERMRRQSPDRAALLASPALFIAAVGVLGLGAVPVPVAVPIAFALCVVGGLIAAAALDVTIMSVLEPGDRHAGAMLSGLSTVGGGLLGYLFTDALLGRAEPAVAFLLGAAVMVFLALAVRRLGRLATTGVDEVIGAEAEAAALANLEDEHAEVPVLAASHVAFSYGSRAGAVRRPVRVQPGELRRAARSQRRRQDDAAAACWQVSSRPPAARCGLEATTSRG
jgi:Na+-transporting methylmalonyl-CoA/oxaloacetate decarboxylase gamma subunit